MLVFRGNPAVAGRRKKFAHEDKALAFAKEQLWFIGEGKMSVDGKSVAGLSDSDRETFMDAVKLLKPVGIGLIAALTDYVAAAKVMGERGSLTLAANDYVKRAAQVEKYNPTSEVVEELLAIMEEELKIKPKRRRDVQTMRSQPNHSSIWHSTSRHSNRSQKSRD